jgi:hypothetical protein
LRRGGGEALGDQLADGGLILHDALPRGGMVGSISICAFLLSVRAWRHEDGRSLFWCRLRIHTGQGFHGGSGYREKERRFSGAKRYAGQQCLVSQNRHGPATALKYVTVIRHRACR